jgi:N-acetylmuramoyl-L-alanine amidase
MMRPVILLFLVTCVSAFAARADDAAVRGVRMWPAPDHTMVVFDLTAPVASWLVTQSGRDRVVIELDHTQMPDAAPSPPADGVLAGLQATSEDKGSRITLELRRPASARVFALAPAGNYGHRLVVKLTETSPVAEAPAAEAPSAKPLAAEMIIAIDAGHGGEDPGAIGRRYRTREKDVTLGVARELAKLVNATPGMRAVLTRNGDYYVPLGRRAMLARRADADIFISLHADSVPGRRSAAKGASVYALSERGATSRLARDLAHSENAADWIGDAQFSELDNDVRGVLGDLTKTATIADSIRFGRDVHRSLDAFGPMHARDVGQAGFAVLKSPVPSILVEMAFISNPSEERNLRSAKHRREMAKAIFSGVQRAMPWMVAARGVPVETPAQREHVVKRGESLTAIARRYRVHVEALRFLNDLPAGKGLRAGATLRIPVSGDGQG